MKQMPLTILRLLIIVGLIFTSCVQKAQDHVETEEPDSTSVAESPRSVEIQKPQVKSEGCNIRDVFILYDKAVQKRFLSLIDSMLLVQYPDGFEESAPADINAKYLELFFKDLDSAQFAREGTVLEQYHMDIYNEDPELRNRCWDDISLQYFEDRCSFYMMILETGVIDSSDTWCHESSVSYQFKIVDGKITRFGRQEAG